MGGRHSLPRDRSQQSRCGWGRTAVRSVSLASLLYTFYTFYTDFKKGVFCNKEGRFLQQSQGYAGRVSQFLAFLATAFTQRGTAGGGRDGGRRRAWLRLGRAGRREDEAKPASESASFLRAARLGAGEAQVEAEGDEVKLPVEEPMTAATL